MGLALQPAYRAACRVRARRCRGRRCDDCRRQHRRLHANHDDGDRAGDLQGRPAARDGARADSGGDCDRNQRRGLGHGPLVRTAGGLTMRAPLSDLPLVLENVSLRAGATPILEGLNLTVAPGAPTLIVGPNGAGKTSLLRLCMGLAAPSEGRVTWGGRTDRAPLRRAIVFQRPVMLRRSAFANIAY